MESPGSGYETLDEIVGDERRSSTEFQEQDLDYEPAEESENEEENKKSINDEETIGNNTSQISSEEDDDIEVLDVISNEVFNSPNGEIEGKKTRSGDSLECTRSSKKRSRSPYKSDDGKSKDRSVEKRSKDRSCSVRRNRSLSLGSLGSDKKKVVNYVERKYSGADLDKVKEHFRLAQNKRKAVASNDDPLARPPNKKLKSKDERDIKDTRSREDWLKAKLESEGRVYIRNFISFPNGRTGDGSFKSNIQKAFTDVLNSDILSTLTPAYCGLCFKDFDDDITAWKHYTGTNHRGTIKRFNRGTYKGHPPFWRMVHERLCSRYPGQMTDQEVYNQVVDNYNVGDNHEKIKVLVKKNIETLVHYNQVGSDGRGGYYVKNKNVQEVRKIFENYYFDKKRKEEEQESRGGRSSLERLSTPNMDRHRSLYGVTSARIDRHSLGRMSGSSGRSNVENGIRGGYPSRIDDRRADYHDAVHIVGRRDSTSKEYPNPAERRDLKGHRLDLNTMERRRDPSSRHVEEERSRGPYSHSVQREGMLVVDPSKLRMLPNGQILIKQDDVVSMDHQKVVTRNKGLL